MFSIIKLKKKQNQKALEPLIATILLIVVSVILVTIVLTWGKEFSTSSLNKTDNFGELKASDATHFIYSKSTNEGVVQFTYSPPAEIKKDINITHYRVTNIPEMTEPIALSEPKILSPSLNILELPCLYEYSTTTPDLYIQLITADNTFIDIKTKDAGMVCSSGGTGTEVDPIVICNAEDLNNVRNDLDANYSLGKDIDLQCFSRLDVNGWLPIGSESSPFIGQFNGDNYTIKNMYIYRPSTTIVGFFGRIGLNSNITISLIDTNVSGLNGVGILAGWADSSAIISNSYTTGNVYGTTEVGGLIGFDYGSINNSYSLANVSGTSFVGGLIGSKDGSGTISNSYSTGLVTGTTTGGFIANYKGGTITNSYWDVNTSGKLTSAGSGATGKTTSEMKTQSTFTDWDFSSIWAIDSTKNDGYPYLRNNPPR